MTIPNPSGETGPPKQGSSSTDAPPVAFDEKSHIRSDLLRDASPEWLLKLTVGIQLVLSTIWGNIVLAFAIPILGLLGMGYVRITLTLMYLVLPLLYMVGVWQLTTPDPAGCVRDDVRRTGDVARWAMVVAIFVSYVNGTWWIGGSGGPGLPVLSAIQDAVAIIGWVALLWYVSALARRLPSNGYAAHCRILAGALGVIGALYTGTSIGADLFIADLHTVAGRDVRIFYLLMVPICAVLCIWGLILLGRIRGKIKDARRFALRMDEDAARAIDDNAARARTRTSPIES